MQKTFGSLATNTTTAPNLTRPHLKRYSEHDLRTNTLQPLLLTQASFSSHPNSTTIRTRFPTLAPLRSHNTHLSNLANQLNHLQQALTELTNDLQSSRQHAQMLSQDLLARQQRVVRQLNNKVAGLAEIVEFCVGEDNSRSQRIRLQCQHLSENSKSIRTLLHEASSRADRIQHALGAYTAHDKMLL